MKKTEEIDGWFGYEKTYLNLIQTIPLNGKFVECGAWLGKSSSYLCDTISSIRPDINVFIVDSWKGSEGETNTFHKLATITDIYDIFLENMGNRKFTSIRDLSVNASQQFEDESLDVVFIDMCHLYHCVLDDIKTWYPKIKNNGYIAGHDWSWPGVSKAVTECFPKYMKTDGDCWVVQKIPGAYNGT